jgi:hypothetical protein
MVNFNTASLSMNLTPGDLEIQEDSPNNLEVMVLQNIKILMILLKLVTKCRELT